MKKLKKKLSLLTALLMLASFAPQGFAEEETPVAEPEVMIYRDFEDFEKGKQLGNSANDYGVMRILFDGTWTSKTEPVQGRTGKGIDANVNHVSDNFTMTDKQSGKIYLTYTTESIKGLKPAYYTKIGTNTSKVDCTYFEWKHGEDFGMGSWTNAMNGTLPAELTGLDYYKIDVIIDLTAMRVKAYVNGVEVADRAISNQLPNSSTNMKIQDNVIFDNLAMVYYADDTAPQTFSVVSGEADVKKDVLRVMLKSDAFDSDGAKKGTEGIAADYGITLPGELDTDAFLVQGMEVLEVRRGDRTGEYEISVDGDISPGQEYVVVANDSLTDVLGATLNPVNNGVAITAKNGMTAVVEENVIVFSEDVYSTWEYSSGATVKNLYTGERGTATLEKQGADSVMISGYEFEYGDEYEITLPEGIRGINGNTLENSKLIFNLGSGGYLKKLNLVDIQGEEHSLDDINPVALDEMEFTFTDDVEASKYVDAIVITDTESNEEFTDYVAECSGNTATLKLNSILAGGKTYKVSIEGLRKNYEIALKTEEAAFKRLPVLYLDSEGKKIKSMGDINAGDTVTVRLDFVNATTTSQSFLASACLFSGQEMIGFGCEEVLMDSVAEGGSGKFSKEFTFEVSKVTGDLKLKGYMWSMNDGMFAPLAPASVF